MSEANVQSTGTLLFDNTPKPMTEDHRSEGIKNNYNYRSLLDTEPLNSHKQDYTTTI